VCKAAGEIPNAKPICIPKVQSILTKKLDHAIKPSEVTSRIDREPNLHIKAPGTKVICSFQILYTKIIRRRFLFLLSQKAACVEAVEKQPLIYNFC